MPACHDIVHCACPLHCKGNPTYTLRATDMTYPAPQSLPCCSIAHRRHLPSPAEAVICRKSNRAVRCRQLGRSASAAQGSCRQVPSSAQRPAVAVDWASRQMPCLSKTRVICTSAAVRRQRTAILTPRRRAVFYRGNICETCHWPCRYTAGVYSHIPGGLAALLKFDEGSDFKIPANVVKGEPMPAMLMRFTPLSWTSHCTGSPSHEDDLVQSSIRAKQYTMCQLFCNLISEVVHITSAGLMCGVCLQTLGE